MLTGLNLRMDIIQMSHSWNATTHDSGAREAVSALSLREGISQKATAEDVLPPSLRAAAGGARRAYCQKQIQVVNGVRDRRHERWFGRKHLQSHCVRNTDVCQRKTCEHTTTKVTEKEKKLTCKNKDWSRKRCFLHLHHDFPKGHNIELWSCLK